MNSKLAASILVVEDEYIIAEDLRQTLVELGYETLRVAASADEAIARAAERCPDLVLMDIRRQARRYRNGRALDSTVWGACRLPDGSRRRGNARAREAKRATGLPAQTGKVGGAAQHD